MSKRPLRVVIYAPHFAEYSARLAMAMSVSCPTLLVLDRQNRLNECEPGLLASKGRDLAVFEYRARTRFERRLYLLLIPLRVMLFRPDIVHIQEQGDVLTASVVRVLRRVFRIALTIHDPQPHSGNDAAYARRKAPYLQLLRETAFLHHVHGPFCRDLVRKVLGPDKPIVSTAHGVLMVPEPSARRAAEPGRVLIFGRMEAYKGLEDLLRAADILRGRGVAFHLVVAGRGPELDRLMGEVSGCADVTVLSKFLSPAEAMAEFQRASVVVAPYRDATQSGVVAAAFGNDRPVIATRAGGLVDSVRHETDGLTVPPRSPQDLADAIERVLTDEAMRARLRAGAEESHRTFCDWGVIAQSLIAGYGAR